MTTLISKRRSHGSFQNVTSHVARVSHGIVNSYLVSDGDSGQWILVDAGLKTSGRHIRRAATELFGRNSRPAAIVLTHGHFDHAGSVIELAEQWNMPVYAHRLETPYLNGRAKYPPPDPTVGGGFMTVMSRFFTRGPINLGRHLHALPENGHVPGLLPNWQWIHTPGHSPGHISLWNERDGVLIAGDAFVTTQQESALAVLKQKQQVSGPPAYFTPDWRLARSSVQKLAALNPRMAATGHGIPMYGAALQQQLQDLALNFDRCAKPRRGRYVNQPALMDELGVISVPPPVPDPLARTLVLTAGVAAVAMLGTMIARRRRVSEHTIA